MCPWFYGLVFCRPFFTISFSFILHVHHCLHWRHTQLLHTAARQPMGYYVIIFFLVVFLIANRARDWARICFSIALLFCMFLF